MKRLAGAALMTAALVMPIAAQAGKKSHPVKGPPNAAGHDASQSKSKPTKGPPNAAGSKN